MKESIPKKMLVLFIALIIGMFSAYAQEQKVNINVSNVSLETLLTKIEEQTTYRFSYRSKLFDDQKPVTMKVRNASVASVLDQAFEGRELDSKVVSSDMIAINKKTASGGTAGKNVTGTVKDQDGMAVIGVYVKDQNSDNYAFTDINGQFALNVTGDGSILVSCLGYEDQIVATNGKSKVAVVVRNANDVLNESVVIGYGVSKRTDLTGSVASVGSNEIKGRAYLNVTDALAGQAAGVSVTPTSGQPGAAPTIRIRGINTLNSNEPLYIIDGMPITENGAEFINTSDIESISILKDAASASIYGSRAGNGVVIITTKKGSEAKPVVTFGTKVGFNQVSKKLDLLNAEEFTMIADEALQNAGKEPYWKGSTGRADSDWQDAIFQNGLIQNYEVNVRGGNQSVRYYLGAGYDNQDGTLYNTNFERYSVKSNVDVNISKKLTVGLNLTYSKRYSKDIEQGVNSVLINACRMPATVPIRNEDGTNGYPVGSEGDGQNPIGYADRSQATTSNSRILLGGYLEYKILPYLSFRSQIAADLMDYTYAKFSPTFSEGSAKNQKASLSESYSWTKNISWENTLNFNKTFGVHEITAMAGHSVIQHDYKYTNATKKEFLSNDFNMRYFDAGTAEDKVTGARSDWALLSFFGRINYSLMGRYLLQMNIRSDASSRFGANNRWGTFPSVGLGWKMSEEKWMKDIEWLDNLKIRASYGVLGTMPTSNYGFTTSLSKTESIMGSGQTVIVGYYPGGKANANYKWETTAQTNVGIDLGVLANRLNVSAEYYNKYTRDILQGLPNPSYTGMSSMMTNIGEIQNSGFEFTASWNDHAGDFFYGISANLTTLKNEVMKLYEDNSPITSSNSRTEVGRSLGEFYGYVTDGIFQNQAEIDAHKVQPNAKPGDIRFKNLNGDDKLNNDDMTFLGSPLPKIYYGFNINMEYKGFDLNMAFQGLFGNKIWYTGNSYLLSGGNNFNKSKEILTRWQKEGDITRVPRVSTSDSNNNFRRSDLFVENGSYLRATNIQLGYSFKGPWMEKIGMSRLRVYVSASNLFCITKYSGYDPAVSLSSVLAPGYDNITYPCPRTIIGGLTVSF